mgnify:CR=1 FL=1
MSKQRPHHRTESGLYLPGDELAILGRPRARHDVGSARGMGRRGRACYCCCACPQFVNSWQLEAAGFSGADNTTCSVSCSSHNGTYVLSNSVSTKFSTGGCCCVWYYELATKWCFAVPGFLYDGIYLYLRFDKPYLASWSSALVRIGYSDTLPSSTVSAEPTYPYYQLDMTTTPTVQDAFTPCNTVSSLSVPRGDDLASLKCVIGTMTLTAL